jgi:calcineurin-like phosphoesterase family protein
MFNTNIKKLLDSIDKNTWIISDTHFGHKTILEFEPSRDTKMKLDGFTDHTEWLIHNWNKTVSSDDLVLHLGDFAFNNIQEIAPKLNGRKILILGNHDRSGTQTYNDFEFVLRGMYLESNNKYFHSESNDALFSCLVKKFNGINILFSHYPCTIEEYRFTNEKINPRIDELISIYEGFGCYINVHGHTHSNNYESNGLVNFKNVSFENIGFKPIRIKDLL